jgi:hypothetical protein
MNEEVESSELVSVYKAYDEITAHLVKGALEAEGIPAVVQSRQVPWMDGVMTMGEGYWGDVMAPEAEKDRSLQVIEAYSSGKDEE